MCEAPSKINIRVQLQPQQPQQCYQQQPQPCYQQPSNLKACSRRSSKSNSKCSLPSGMSCIRALRTPSIQSNRSSQMMACNNMQMQGSGDCPPQPHFQETCCPDMPPLGIPSPECMSPRPLSRSMTLECCNQPRADCCRIPCCPPTLPKCPVGIFVERVKPILPDRQYHQPTMKFEGVSTYRDAFKCSNGRPSKPFIPHQAAFDPSAAKMEGITMYREAYTCKPVVPYQKPPWSRGGRYEPSAAKMEGFTTYREDFKGCMNYEKTKPFLPDEHRFDPSDAKMDGLTTYKSNYIPYCSREYKYAKQPLYKRNVTPSFSCAPFESMSTYRSSFFPKCCAKRKNMKPTQKTRFSDAKLDGVTTYKNDYFPFHFQRCVGPCIPADCYPNCADFACGLVEDPKIDFDNFTNCESMSRPVSEPGTCGNELGLREGQPLPPCMQEDPNYGDIGTENEC